MSSLRVTSQAQTLRADELEKTLKRCQDLFDDKLNVSHPAQPSPAQPSLRAVSQWRSCLGMEQGWWGWVLGAGVLVSRRVGLLARTE